MKHIYFVALVGATFFCCFLCGREIGRAQCRAQITTHAYESVVANINQGRDIDEKVLHTTGGDIRRILREKYTIAE